MNCLIPLILRNTRCNLYIVKNFISATDRYLTNIMELGESILKEDALNDKDNTALSMVDFMQDINSIHVSVSAGKFLKEKQDGTFAKLTELDEKELAKMLRSRSQYYRILNKGLYFDAREISNVKGILLKDSYEIAPRDPDWRKEEEKAMRAGKYREGNARTH